AKRLEQIKATTEDTARIQLVEMNVRWFREFLAHDPARSLEKISIPVLAVTGGKDIQVDPHDTDRICELVGASCTARIIPDMTHLLRFDAGEPSVRTYKKQAERPVDSRLTDLVGTWITERATIAGA
ncbi:MAG: alpha/beta hydrolase, partial [Acidimicrobiia bacterium]|nr:alpha/beta hydrolase [Acidimicrobiia bacterium]